MGKRFVLVHGAWHGAWCWESVVPLLREAGHEVLAPDLPGHGAHPATGRLSLKTYATFLAALLSELNGEAVLVGHSMGGMVISAATALAPRHVSALVYLAAFAPRAGDSVFSLMDENRAAAGPSPVEALMRLTPDRRCYGIDREAAAGIFFNGCDPASAVKAVRRLTPQPLLPLSGRLENGGAGKDIPCHYIACLRDRVIPLEHQRRMAQRRGCRHWLELDTGHSPFLERPEELAELLGGI